MTDFRALCAELVDSIELLLEMRSPNAGRMRITERRLRVARAALADEPAVPTVMEIVELSSEIEAAGLGQVDFARAVLARWGNPAPVPPAEGEVGELVPVPVSERLPGPEDCDAEHYCWRWNTIGRLWARQPLARSWYEFESHWLPAHALPIPHQQENAND